MVAIPSKGSDHVYKIVIVRAAPGPCRRISDWHVAAPNPLRVIPFSQGAHAMIKLEKVLYTARAHTTGGRDGGASRTDDGRLEVRLSLPGTPANGTNPEQLFAAGWSACFLSAIKLAAHKM